MVNNIRGVYVSSDFIYTIVMENKETFRDYIGVIIDSKNKLWKKVQIKLELKHKEKNKLATMCIIYP